MTWQVVVVGACLALASCGDDHEAVRHEHGREPMPKLTHLTGSERDELRAALQKGIVQAKAGIAMSDPGVMSSSSSSSSRTRITTSGGMTAVFEAHTDGPTDAVDSLDAARSQVAGCLGSMTMELTFDMTMARSGEVVGAFVAGAGSHKSCVEDMLRALHMPIHDTGYAVRGRIVYK